MGKYDYQHCLLTTDKQSKLQKDEWFINVCALMERLRARSYNIRNNITNMEITFSFGLDKFFADVMVDLDDIQE